MALKAIRPELVGDADTAERFRREVLVTRDIAHDGLCRVFDLVEHPIDGRSRRAGGHHRAVPDDAAARRREPRGVAERRRPMTPGRGAAAARADRRRAAGAARRGGRPSRSQAVERHAGATPDGLRAVLTDFGLAKPLDESLFETRRAVQGGAPFFMAPELFRGERPSHASDIYAFGLLIDEMVTTRRAFAADSLHGPAAAEARRRAGARRRGARRRCRATWEQRESALPGARSARSVRASAKAVCASLPDGIDRSAAGCWRRRWRRACRAASAMPRPPPRWSRAGPCWCRSTPAAGNAVFIRVRFENLTGPAGTPSISRIGTASELGRRP